MWLNLFVIFMTMGVMAHSPPNYAISVLGSAGSKSDSVQSLGQFVRFPNTVPYPPRKLLVSSLVACPLFEFEEGWIVVPGELQSLVHKTYAYELILRRDADTNLRCCRSRQHQSRRKRDLPDKDPLCWSSREQPRRLNQRLTVRRACLRRCSTVRGIPG